MTTRPSSCAPGTRPATRCTSTRPARWQQLFCCHSAARVWDADTGKPVGEPMEHGGAVISASFSPDGKRVVTASSDNTARVWNAFWPSLVRPENLIEEVCQRKLRGNVRMITEADVRAARILSPQRVEEDVCDGVATVPTR